MTKKRQKPATFDDMRAAIAVFRKLESNNDIIPAIGDADAMRVLAAWSKTANAWSAPAPATDAVDHVELWRWLCSGWTFDVAAIALGSGCTADAVRAKLEMLRAARMIYPDGEMSKPARALLTSYAADRLGLKKNEPPKPKSGRDDGTDHN